MIKVQRALISVSNKKGILPFAKGLHRFGIEILSTGGTARQIREAGIPVKDVSQFTGFPEMLDGRVKTLHPFIHGGILADRGNPDHMRQVKDHKIGLIDMVVVNLYPFEQVTSKKRVKFEDAVENIDIGGPTMIRAAAKNHSYVAVICDPDRYPEILKELDTNSGILSDAVLYQLAVDAFEHTAHYDRIIAAYFQKRNQPKEFGAMPNTIRSSYTKVQDLRYGENPHQHAAFYQTEGEPCGLAKLQQLHGKELSFNNILDVNAAIDFIKDLDKPTAVIIKHNNPTGLAQHDNLTKAYRAAHACDPISAFGGIIGMNRKIDGPAAAAISQSGFMECVIAPGFDKKALEILQKKKNLRLIAVDFKQCVSRGYDTKNVFGGLLAQERDTLTLQSHDIKIVTKKRPTASQLKAMRFGWSVIRNVKSNAIILVKGEQTVGIGCGQTSRIESLKIAIEKSGKKAKGSVMISDAFLPKTDNVELAAKAGISAIIQTGGSIADNDVIQCCNDAGIAMVLTGIRHFKH